MYMEIYSNSFMETKSDNIQGSRSPKDGLKSISKIENGAPQNEASETPQAVSGERMRDRKAGRRKQRKLRA